MSVRSSLRSAVGLIAVTVVSACGSDSASPEAPKAASVQAVGSASLTGTVGAAVATAPAVRVLTSTGAPVPGTPVTFAVTSGAGTLGTTNATTDATGTASAGTWTLGTAAGTNTVTATVTGFAPVTFTAVAAAGPAATLTVSAGDNQSAVVGASVATAPAVVVKDQYGNPVAGVPVTFSVDAGNGTLTGATATTGADGVARVGSWTLGIATGTQRIKATAGTLSATIAATATVPVGCAITNYALGATLPLNWDANDCTKINGRRYDQLTFTTTQQQIIDASVTGANGRQLFLRDKDSLYVGLQPSTAFSPAAQNPMHLKYILAPNTYTFEPTATDANTTGAYTFATTTNAAINCDYIIFASTNVTFSGVVDNSSCLGPVNDREQWINLQLKTGMKVRLTLSGTDDVPFLILRDDRLGPASPTLITARGTTKGEMISLTWTATFDTWHEIIVTSATANLLGKYTLKIEQLP